MPLIRPTRLLALASVICAVSTAIPAAQQAMDAITVPFSDPGRPGSVRVSMHSGGIVVKGGGRKDVIVSSRARAEETRRDQAPAPPGFRRLTQSAGLNITEDNNQMSINATSMGRSMDVEVQTPSRVNLKLSTMNDGEILVENAEGEIDATNHNGPVTLTNVAGWVVASSHNGKVVVRLTRLTTDKAMAFTSFNGDVDVTLPATAKAFLKLRSDQGEIFTDFDVQMQPTPPPAQPTRRSDGRVRIEVNRSIYGSINGGGPEFELRTYNGNIYVRKGAQ